MQAKPPPRNGRRRLVGQQRARRVVHSLGLEQLPVANRPSWLTVPSTGRDEITLAAGQRAHPRAQRAGEECVEGGVGVRVGLGRLAAGRSSGSRSARRGPAPCAARAAAACEAVHAARQQVLRQQLLQQRESAIGRAGFVGGNSHRAGSCPGEDPCGSRGRSRGFVRRRR